MVPHSLDPAIKSRDDGAVSRDDRSQILTSFEYNKKPSMTLTNSLDLRLRIFYKEITFVAGIYVWYLVYMTL